MRSSRIVQWVLEDSKSHCGKPFEHIKERGQHSILRKIPSPVRRPLLFPKFPDTRHPMASLHYLHQAGVEQAKSLISVVACGIAQVYSISGQWR